MNVTTFSIHTFNDAFGEKTAESTNIYVLLFILWPLAIFTVLGNALAIWAFVTDSRIQSNVTNRYIFCLSISDLIIGCVSLPFNNVWLHFGRWPMGETVCKIWLVIDYAACYLSVMAILLLSYDRFLWVSWPLKYRQSQTAKMATVKILITTAFVFVFFTIPILFWDIWVGEKHIDYRKDCEPENSGNFIYGLVFVIFETILPALGIGVLNILVYLRIRKTCVLRERSFRNIQDIKKTRERYEIDTKESKYENQELHPKTCGSSFVHGKQDIHLDMDVKESEQPPNSYINGYRKAGRRLATMVGVFLFCWIPYNVCLLYNALCIDCIGNATWETVNYLLWGNSALNPVLYALTNERYKRRMMSVITWKKPMLHSRESVGFELQ
ncbi:histamine H3 receptor-like [Amphiura filiformis]|uniref:histamine H3 receptor-like n=1 Tax=Amphiura filiformis TaxID=82378 RepID=UPI003B21DEC6